MSALVVAILAGGLSSRMGQDKRFLKIDQESLLDRAISLGEKLGRVLICGDVPGRDCLPDQILNRGPVSGLLSAVHAIQSPTWILVLPVDMPLLTVDFLKDFLKKAERPGVVYQNHELPFLFWCDERVVSILENLERWSIKAFLESLRVKFFIPEASFESCFLNLNSLQDWEKLREYSV